MAAVDARPHLPVPGEVAPTVASAAVPVPEVAPPPASRTPSPELEGREVLDTIEGQGFATFWARGLRM